MDWDRIHIIYFLGIGGIGMSALVRYFLHLGKDVHGYDLTPTPLTRHLENEGAYIHYKEDPSKIPGNTDLVIYTPAIPLENEEMVRVRSMNAPLFKRAEIMGEITRDHFTVAVAGTHGKTSISAITSHILHSAGIPLTALVGGIMKNYDSNVLISDEPQLFVVEADEFDRSFLQLHPNIALISSTDADHLDIYAHHEELIKGFELFAGRLSDPGTLVLNDRLSISTHVPHIVRYGTNANADIRTENIRVEKGFFIFDISYKSGRMTDIRMEIPGRHYAENATAAAAIALQLGVDGMAIKEALEKFRGVERRFEFIINTPELVYIDDYAHHPEEIRVTLEALATLFPDRKKTGIFQPHLFSRTRDFANEFAQSLENLDEVILLPIYPAREKPVPGVTSEMLLDKMNHTNKKLVSKGQLIREIANRKIEVLITLGAGDIGMMTGDIKETLLDS